MAAGYNGFYRSESSVTRNLINNPNQLIERRLDDQAPNENSPSVYGNLANTAPNQPIFLDTAPNTFYGRRYEGQQMPNSQATPTISHLVTRVDDLVRMVSNTLWRNELKLFPMMSIPSNNIYQPQVQVQVHVCLPRLHLEK